MKPKFRYSVENFMTNPGVQYFYINGKLTGAIFHMNTAMKYNVFLGDSYFSYLPILKILESQSK